MVPVAVTGMYEVLRKGSWLMRPGHAITVHVLAPIETEGLSDEEILALARKVEAQIAEVVDAYWAERGLLPEPKAAEGGAA